MAREELEDFDDQFRERVLQSDFALLSTLANIAGVFIGAASLLATLSPHTPRGYFLAIIALCGVVLMCVVFDFRFYRRSYQSVAFTPKQIWDDPAIADAYSDRLERQKVRARIGRRWKRRRERVSYACLVAAVLLFITVVCRY